MKTIGVLGGMGPYASIEFYRKVLELSNPASESGHVRVVMDSNPHIPSRNRHFIYGEPSPVPGMVESITRLMRYPVDSVYIPCNSASFFIPEIRKEILGDIVDTIEVTARAVERKIPNGGEVLVLGAYIVRNKAPYQSILNELGFRYVTASDKIQERTEQIIYSTKEGNVDSAKKFTELLLSLIEAQYKGISAIVLACTELCITFDEYAGRFNIPIIDSNHELASHLVENAHV